MLDSLYRVDSGRIRGTLIRLLGDFDLAGEAMHEAFAAVLGPVAADWSTRQPATMVDFDGRFKAIDTLRRRARFDASQDELVRYLEGNDAAADFISRLADTELILEAPVAEDYRRIQFRSATNIDLRPIRGEMFIEHATSKRFFLAPAERNISRPPRTTGGNIALRWSASYLVNSTIYKHLAPGAKTNSAVALES